MGTYCGWCETTRTGMRGGPKGPDSGTCSDWVWVFKDCQKSEAPQVDSCAKLQISFYAMIKSIFLFVWV